MQRSYYSLSGDQQGDQTCNSPTIPEDQQDDRTSNSPPIPEGQQGVSCFARLGYEEADIVPEIINKKINVMGNIVISP